MVFCKFSNFFEKFLLLTLAYPKVFVPLIKVGMRFILIALISSIFLHGEEKTTHHTLMLENQLLSYTATVGTLPAKDSEGAVKGEIGYTAYFKENPGANRPITFCFNGGPGSASLWLHVGAFGPRKIVSTEEGGSIVPPYEMRDNLDTILDLTDLVFVDPMGTGFSKPNSKEDGQQFYGIKEDVRSLGDFIHDFITKHQRWNSPKYIAGESYGTTRSAGLSHYLQTEHGMYLNGVILISCAIDFQTFFFQRNIDNQLPYFLYLPTYTATAWYHGKYRPDASIQDAVDDAVQYSYKTLAPFLLRNSSFNKEAVYRDVAELSGLNQEFVRRNQGKFDANNFIDEFFGDERKVLGVYDTRLVGDAADTGKDPFFENPSVSTMAGIVEASFRNYLQNELEFSPEKYISLSFDVYTNWNFFSYSPWGYPNMMDSLRSAMIINPKMKVFVGSGYYDCVTPFAATDYCFDHLDLPDSYKSNLQMEYYEGGHMYYLNPKARQKFKQDLIQFYNN